MFKVDENYRLYWDDLDLDCKCSYHSQLRVTTSMSTNHTTPAHEACARDRILTKADSDRRCLDMGCQQIVKELNSRLGTNFNLQNSYVAFSLHFCMHQDLDFGTAFAYFMATAVKVCTSSLSCSFKRALQSQLGGRTGIGLPRGYLGTRVITWFMVICPYHVFGTHPDFEAYVDTVTARLDQPWFYKILYTRSGDIDLGYIVKPYESLPRRLWDTYSNRVIPTELLTLKSCENGCTLTLGDLKLATTFWAISHSWTEEMVASLPSVLLTRINGKAWPVPIPHGVSLHDVRAEILGLISLKKNAQPQTTLYCWLDILCLRQKSEEWCSEALRAPEWETDVPTIGQTYRISEGVIRYFNGLGKPFSTSSWDSNRHWLNRVWTLQEIRDEVDETLTGGIYSPEVRALMLPTNFSVNIQGIFQDQTPMNSNFGMDIQGLFQGQTKRLADIIMPLQKIAKDCASTAETGGCSILELIQEMRRRHATNDIDKIAGLSFLLLSETLPRYYNAATPEEAWVASLVSVRYIIKLELLYNFPFVRSSGSDELDLDDMLWTPTWSQVIRQPAPIHSYDRPVLSTKARTVCDDPDPKNLISESTLQKILQSHLSDVSSILQVFDAFVVEECEILEGTYLRNEREEYIKYMIQVNLPSQQSQLDHPRFAFEFCSPRYRVDGGIGTPNCDNPCILPPILQAGKYILATHSLSASSGWVIGKRRGVHPKQETLTVSAWKDQVKIAENELDSELEAENEINPELEAENELDSELDSFWQRLENSNPSQDRHMKDHSDEWEYFIEKVGVVNTEDIGRLKESGCLSSGMTCYFC